MPAAIILAAGLSTRLGRPKQTLVLHGEMLIERAVRIATEAACSPVIAVIIDSLLVDRLLELGAMPLINRNTWQGISSSIQTGLQGAIAAKAEGAVILTCDQPTLTADHLSALAAQPAIITGSGYAGKIGIPAYFPASAFKALLQLQGDTGARDLLREARVVPNESLALDIDTEADLLRAQTLL